VGPVALLTGIILVILVLLTTTVSAAVPEPRSVKNSKTFFSIVPTAVPPEKPTLPAWATDREGAAGPFRGQR